jgi:hypothetical protein
MLKLPEQKRYTKEFTGSVSSGSDINNHNCLADINLIILIITAFVVPGRTSFI